MYHKLVLCPKADCLSEKFEHDPVVEKEVERGEYWARQPSLVPQVSNPSAERLRLQTFSLIVHFCFFGDIPPIVLFFYELVIHFLADMLAFQSLHLATSLSLTKLPLDLDLSQMSSVADC